MDLFPNDAPEVLREFLVYMFNTRGASQNTVNEYYLDLRTFFRYLKRMHGLVPNDLEFDDIPIDDVGIDLLQTVKLSHLYDYLFFIGTQRPKHHKSPATALGDDAPARARKVASLRSFFKFITVKRAYLTENPAAELESPKLKKDLPKYLTLEDCHELLEAVQGKFKERDYCILMLFLNCGLRVSELVALDLGDIQDYHIRVTGKGNKVRILYLNPACQEAIANYLPHRLLPKEPADRNALFVSRELNRINVQTVKWLVKKYLTGAGLSAKQLSTHKLRHTAATLMYQNGVDIRTVQEVLGHENVNTTMIYTHIANPSIKAAAMSNPLSTYQPQAADRDEEETFMDDEEDIDE